MPSLIVVMGVSGSGKSIVGARLASRLDIPFCEGDDLHPIANIAKMTAAHPLDDDDRAPWLDHINHWMHAHQDGGVVSCSSLRRCHRDRLRRGLTSEPTFVLLDPPAATLNNRLAMRRGHFMPATLLESQLATLERPTPDECALRLLGDRNLDELLDEIIDGLTAADEASGRTRD